MSDKEDALNMVTIEDSDVDREELMDCEVVKCGRESKNVRKNMGFDVHLCWIHYLTFPLWKLKVNLYLKWYFWHNGYDFKWSIWSD